jgi:hypothetical protein
MPIQKIAGIAGAVLLLLAFVAVPVMAAAGAASQPAGAQNGAQNAGCTQDPCGDQNMNQYQGDSNQNGPHVGDGSACTQRTDCAQNMNQYQGDSNQNGAKVGDGSGCTQDTDCAQNMNQYQGAQENAGTGASVQAAPLTEAEIYWLKFMREEEKVARDVYLALDAQWGMQIFENIAKSEQRHMDAVETLLIRYGVEDPVAGEVPGVFTDAFLPVYDELILQGSISQVEALNVGVLIEETDIEDLNEAIALAEHKDIQTVYGNLLQGSLNHLDAFESVLAKN